jgi:hypothetical protein
MASQREMLAELESLALKPRLNSLNDNQEISKLVENIKQEYFKEYKDTYNQNH